MEVVMQLKRDGVEACPVVLPYTFVVSGALSCGEGVLFPLSSLANTPETTEGADIK